MPLTPRYTWEETESSLIIQLTGPGFTKDKTDILICDVFLRVNCPPQLLQLDLYKSVDDASCTAVFGPSGLTCRLNKVAPGLWTQLLAQGSKQDMKDRRQDAMQRLESRLQAAKKARLDHKQTIDRAVTDRRIELDRNKRDAIEQRKQQELSEQRAQVMSWESKVGATDGSESDHEELGEDVSAASSSTDHAAYHGRGWRHPKPMSSHQDDLGQASDKAAHQAPGDVPGKQPIWDKQSPPDVEECDAADDAEQSVLFTAAQDATESCQKLDLPPMRPLCSPVTVEFTKLETDHLPARENREQEINGCKRNAEEAKPTDDNVDMSERQPMFLKDKGDAMHRAANYRAAVNAYTRALELDASLTVCYSNRAASYLKIQEYRSCIDDCTTALAQLEAASNSPAGGSSSAAGALISSMVKLLTRRATARVELLELEKAAADLEQALKWSPSDQQLQGDLNEIRACLQPADSKSLRCIGDARFKAQDLQGASDAYTAVLALPDATLADKMAAASNRAACGLAQRQYSNAVDDCNLAFSVLIGSSLQAPPHVHAWLSDNGADQFGSQQKQSLARLFARRGAALGHLRRYRAAALDLRAAQGLYKVTNQPAKAAALNADVQSIENQADYGGSANACSTVVKSFNHVSSVGYA